MGAFALGLQNAQNALTRDAKLMGELAIDISSGGAGGAVLGTAGEAINQLMNEQSISSLLQQTEQSEHQMSQPTQNMDFYQSQINDLRREIEQIKADLISRAL